MAANPYVNAVYKADGTKIIDISDSNIVANKFASGYSAYDKTGAKITGSLTEQAATTITPSGSQQTAVASGKYTTGNVVVSAVPEETNPTFTENGTYTPATGKWWKGVTVNVPGPSGTYTIPLSATGTIDVSSYANVSVATVETALAEL